MPHLHHGASNHLLHNAAGNLANACGAAASCPTNCAACPGTLHLTVSGLGGPGPACCIAALNGTFTLTRTGSNCQWTSGVFFKSGGCSFGWEITCQTVDCHGVAGAMRWTVQLYGSINFVWAEQIASTTCPPTGSYGICQNSCSGGTGATVVVS